MIGWKLKPYRGDGAGFGWPTQTDGVDTIEEAFGPRTFASPPHTYAYDFHPGIDVYTTQGATLYAPITGAVCRVHFTHYGFEDSSQLDNFSATTPSSSLSAAHGTNAVTFTCSRVGAITWPTNVDFYWQESERMNPENDNWVIELEFSSAPSFAAGAFGMGFVDSVTSPTEWATIEYDGTTFTTRAKGNGVSFTCDGSTYAAASKTWMRIDYTRSTDTYRWQHSTDGETWTTLVTETTRAFASATPYMVPCMYWRSGDTSGTPYTVNVSTFNWYDDNQNVGRFGNWLTISQSGLKVCVVHFRTLSVTQGSFVSVGKIVGTAGATGFDQNSGRVNSEHAHLEYVPNNNSAYLRAESRNPLNASLLPRANVSNNVSVVRTSGGGTVDPDGNAAHKLAITVTRADQDFDVNEISFTGNSATSTLNFDTRSGLNADVDIPFNATNGTYIVPTAFTEASSTLVLTVYFRESVVGATFVSWYVKDCAGTTLASE